MNRTIRTWPQVIRCDLRRVFESELSMENTCSRKDSPQFDDIGLSPRTTAAKISLGYAALGWLWILSSDSLVPLLTKDIEMMVFLNSLKGSLFIITTAGVLFLLLRYYLEKVGYAQKKNILYSQNLENAFEELAATDEELHRQYQELSMQSEKLEAKDREIWTLFENMHDSFAFHEIVFDGEGRPIDYRFLNVNPAYEKMMGKVRGDLIGRSIREIMPDIDEEWIRLCGEVAVAGKTIKLKVFSKQLGRYFDMSLHSSQSGHFAMLSRDITDQREHESTVERLAYYDTLTGLPNRVLLLKNLQQELSVVNAGGALLYIDMDDLKMVNDSYGHSYGDALIFTAAMHVVSVSEPGSTVARTGGDEFVIIVPGLTDPVKVEQIASELVETISRDYEVYDVRVHASASVGIVMYPRDGSTAEAIMKNADTALHEAKRGGKRCWRFFQPSMQEMAFENMVLTNGLRDALKRGELTLHFQPQVLLANYHVAAFEALLRWQSPTYGNVPPSRFIPLAEASHLIESIGTWVLLEACKFLGRLADLGKTDVRVAVNVSPRQLSAPDFIDIVRSAIMESGIDAGCLEIEITENVLIESMEESIQKLNELSALGVRLALDDFGTGYSSLTYLRQLPVGTVKIDKSFIDRIMIDESHAKLIEAIINMSHILGLTVVAEGVETPEQLSSLSEYRCDMIQGYAISKALPEAAALTLLNNTWLPNIVACMAADHLLRRAGAGEMD